MNDTVRLDLQPMGRTLSVERGTPLAEVLFAQGVEFPCGGHGRCKGCRVKVLHGILSVKPGDERGLSSAELAAGWRLACQARAEGDLAIELGQWEATILSDDSTFAFVPRDGFGVAIDVGTTTLVAQLLDLQSGKVCAVRTALNAQARRGADIMSRIEFALGGGREELVGMIRNQLGRLIDELWSAMSAGDGISSRPLREIVLVGNTAMHHLFGDLDVEPLSRFPFEPENSGLLRCAASEVGWTLPGDPVVRFLPCLGSFVGSDLLAGVLATRLHQKDELSALVDLGTNGEIVVGHRGRMLCASTAAGPAFEGARISQGMRAVSGAIAGVSAVDGGPVCRVLGHGPARGLCGSGLVDAVAVGLTLGRIDATGRYTAANGGVGGSGTRWELAPGVALSQADIRELQLAKGAIAAGLRLLLEPWGAVPSDLGRVYLAGAFGNYINRASAHRIGLLDLPPDRVVPAGNTALLGAKLALFDPGTDDDFSALRRCIRHVALSENARFLDIFAESMRFP